MSSDVAALASLMGLPAPLAQLADPFSDDTVRIYTSMAAVREAAGLPALRSKVFHAIWYTCCNAVDA